MSLIGRTSNRMGPVDDYYNQRNDQIYRFLSYVDMSVTLIGPDDDSKDEILRPSGESVERLSPRGDT